MTREELAAKLGKNVKITTTRLSELVKDGLAAKTDEGNYRMPTIGIARLLNEALPRIKAKICSAQ